MESYLTLEDVKSAIRNVPDFPKKGIQFKDLTTAFKQPEIIQFLVKEISTMYIGRGITKVVAIESRGFILGGALAAFLGAGFVPIRKPGKLPADKYSINYSLEYGDDALEIHKDAIKPGEIILLHDDLLATGGTMHAALKLIENFKPDEVYLNFIVELNFLEGRKKLGNEYDITSMIHL